VHAALAPESHDELLDEGFLGEALGGEVFEEGVAEGVEQVGVLVGQDGDGGGEAVFQGIEARASFAFGGTRAGTEFRHEDLPTSIVRGGSDG
jgi:hypothetical protein